VSEQQRQAATSASSATAAKPSTAAGDADASPGVRRRSRACDSRLQTGTSGTPSGGGGGEGGTAGPIGCSVPFLQPEQNGSRSRSGAADPSVEHRLPTSRPGLPPRRVQAARPASPGLVSLPRSPQIMFACMRWATRTAADSAPDVRIIPALAGQDQEVAWKASFGRLVPENAPTTRSTSGREAARSRERAHSPRRPRNRRSRSAVAPRPGRCPATARKCRSR